MSRTDLPARPHVAVVGAGWAGCAAAVALARNGHHVNLFESSRTLGGRARRVKAAQTPLDNGQHILLGAYSQTLNLMREVGIDIGQAVLRLPMQMRYPAFDGGMEFVAARLPAPWHLAAATLCAKGLNAEDKLAMARFSSAARWMGWQLHQDCAVSELLERFDQTDNLIRLMWRPLCIAALTTPPERASAQAFLSVLRDSLGATRAASDMLLPRTDLTALFPECAARHLERHGGTIRLGTPVRAIHRSTDHGWLVEHGASSAVTEAFDGIVLAAAPWQAFALLREHIDTTSLAGLQYEPITTCYLQYSPGLRLPSPFFALIDDPTRKRWAQFVFDRGQLHATQAGLLACVISASQDAIQDGHDALAVSIVAQLAGAFGMPELAQPAWSRVITEKRACFSCTPGLVRPENLTGLPGLVLAGDYTAGDYPATLEGAARSGAKAAELLSAMLHAT